MAAFGVGAALALTTTGLPLNANGDREGGPFAWFSGYAVLGGLAVVGFSLLHGLAFLALKTDGDVRHRARAVVRPAPARPAAADRGLGGQPAAAQRRSRGPWPAVVAAVVAAVLAWNFARTGAEGRAFLSLGAFLLLGSASIFGAAFPVVLPSTLNPAFNLTISNASSSDYTLGLMSIVACVGLPLVLAYQAWTYWVFRRRVSARPHPRGPQLPPRHRRQGAGTQGLAPVRPQFPAGPANRAALYLLGLLAALKALSLVLMGAGRRVHAGRADGRRPRLGARSCTGASRAWCCGP